MTVEKWQANIPFIGGDGKTTQVSQQFLEKLIAEIIALEIAKVPSGGSSGQVLKKSSATDYDTAWQNESGGGGSPAWGSITGTLSSQTDLQTELDGKAASSHNHAAGDINSGTLADARVAQSNVTQHEGAIDHDALSGFVANEHIDWTGDAGASNIHVNNITAVPQAAVIAHEGALDALNLTNAPAESGATADQTDAEIETAYNNQVSIVSQAEAEAGTATTPRRWTAQRVGQAISALGSGGSVTPGATLVFEGTLSSTTQNTNATSHDYTWNDATEHADITHTDGDSVISVDVAGEYLVYFNIEVTDGQANNRQTWAAYIDHLNSSSVSQFEYAVASGSYIRDDASTYDSGMCAGYFMLILSADEKLVLRSKRLDAQTGAGNNYASQANSYLRIFRKSY